MNSLSDDFRRQCCHSCCCESHRLLNKKWLLMVEQRVVAIDTSGSARKQTNGASGVKTGPKSSGVVGVI